MIRKEQQIRCITLDLDRTTLNKQGHLSDGNRKALLDAMQNGIHVVVASGRSLDTLPQDILDMEGIEYAITSNGAGVYRMHTGEYLREYKMTPESVEQILELTKDEPVAYECFIRGKAYGQKEYVEDPVKYGATERAIPYIQSTREPVADFREFILEHRFEMDSIDVIVRSEEMKQRIWNYLEEQVGDIYITSSIQQLLEISYKESGKHSGVRFMLEYLGLPCEALAAFGDGDNDAEMLKFAGIGLAVENASEGCKAAADYIVPHHDEDGVAWGIYNVILS